MFEFEVFHLAVGVGHHILGLGLEVVGCMMVELEGEDYMQEGLEVGFEVPHKMWMGLGPEDYRQEGLEEVGVPRSLDWGLVQVESRQEELEGEVVPHRNGLDLELGFEIHHMMGWDLVLVDYRKAGLGAKLGSELEVAVHHKLVEDLEQALQML